MKKIIATVTVEGRFLKAITNEGKDVSNQIDRSLRRKAAAENLALEYDSVADSWNFASSASVASANTKVELIPVDSEHEAVKTFIHSSVGLKPDQLS